MHRRRGATFRKFCVWSAYWGQNGGSDHSRVSDFLSAELTDILATSQRPIFTGFGHDMLIHVSSKTIERGFRKYVHKTSKLKGAKHLTLTSLQLRDRTADGYSSLHFVPFVWYSTSYNGVHSKFGLALSCAVYTCRAGVVFLRWFLGLSSFISTQRAQEKAIMIKWCVRVVQDHSRLSKLVPTESPCAISY